MALGQRLSARRTPGDRPRARYPDRRAGDAPRLRRLPLGSLLSRRATHRPPPDRLHQGTRTRRRPAVAAHPDRLLRGRPHALHQQCSGVPAFSAAVAPRQAAFGLDPLLRLPHRGLAAAREYQCCGLADPHRRPSRPTTSCGNHYCSPSSGAITSASPQSSSGLTSSGCSRHETTRRATSILGTCAAATSPSSSGSSSSLRPRAARVLQRRRGRRRRAAAGRRYPHHRRR